MKQLREMIEKISVSPHLYLGKPSLDRLRSYINGFLDHNELADDGSLDGFTEYVAEKYNMQTDHDWSSYIQFFSNSEQDAYNKFVQYFGEYQAKKAKNNIAKCLTATNMCTNGKPAREDGFQQMMDRVLSSPELYLGKPSLERLHAYINGYLAHEDITDNHLLDGFNQYIKRKYRIQTEHNWPEIISFFSCTDRDAFDSFTKHFRDFQRKTEDGSMS